MKHQSTVVATGSLDFALHTLGWRSFQDLCGAILRVVCGQTFKTFADSNDAGRDGAFYGKWTHSELVEKDKIPEVPSGATVAQCKFTARAGGSLSLSNAQSEIAKIKKLVEKGLCDNYILITNASVSGASETKIANEIKKCGVKNVYVLDGKWICRTISENRQLRLYVPRVYGLGDLTKILDERAYRQSEALLGHLKDELSTFVVTEAYTKAATALKDHSFVFLIGEPASGKSLIAASLAMAAIDNWQCVTVQAKDPNELLAHWDPDEPNQFFWIDDAFGATYYDKSLGNEWAHALPQIAAAIKKGAKIVITSRDYIYSDASKALKEYAYPFLHEQKVVVQVADLTKEERERILYNHVRLGNHPREFKSKLKPHLPAIAKVERFLPEVARRLGDKIFSANLDLRSKDEVVRFMECPDQFLQEVIGGLSAEHLAALCLVYQSGTLEYSGSFTEPHAGIIGKFGVTEFDVSSALQSLESSFLRQTSLDDNGTRGNFYTFKHPTLREGFSRYLTNRPELLDVLVKGMTYDELFTQLDFGNSDGSKGRKSKLLSIPASNYDSVLDKCRKFQKGESDGSTSDKHILLLRYYMFLTNAPASFLSRYLQEFPDFREKLLQFHGILSWEPRISLLGNLQQYGLLGEENRRVVAARIKEIALDDTDSSWLNDGSCNRLLTEEEREGLIADARDQLINDLDDILSTWESNEDKDRGSYYEPLIESLEDYSEHFQGDLAVRLAISHAQKQINERIAEWERYSLPDDRDELPQVLDQPTYSNDRNIFEDVDL